MINILLAQEEHPLGGSFKGKGPLGETWRFALRPEDAIGMFNKVISNIVGIMTVAAGLWFIFQFFIGAFSWMTAGGDKAAMENAQKKITNAVIGLVIIVAAIFIIDLLGRLLGLSILSPGKFIQDIWKP